MKYVVAALALIGMVGAVTVPDTAFAHVAKKHAAHKGASHKSAHHGKSHAKAPKA